MPKPALSPTQAPAVIDIEPAQATPAAAWSKAKRYVELTGHYLAASCAAQIMAGIELIELQKHYPETRGRKIVSRGTILDTRTWEEAMKAELGIGKTTAWRWMEMAKAAKKRLAKNATDLAALLDQAPSALTEAEREALKHAVHKITDGQTQSELMLEWGITKAPQGSGAGKPKAVPAPSGEPGDETTEATGAAPATPRSPLPAGWEEQSHGLRNILTAALQHGWWKECDLPALQLLHGDLIDLSAQVSDAIKGRTRK